MTVSTLASDTVRALDATEEAGFLRGLMAAFDHVDEHLQALRLEKEVAQRLNDDAAQNGEVDVVDETVHDPMIRFLLHLETTLSTLRPDGQPHRYETCPESP